ncbi:NAD(P)H-hydrate dehydratase [Pontibacter sp. G13]|uniref:NAD(P)H-hydrate dehydratase n=1 Tax=Pontibacter sp. G13 TaxID=3074898 RepID=UPI00288BD074|nr:NAD(P)H-hydrate dehydratase [Pontibacter sp. G13]WNJ18487.1 NAD(P)H-hydrate dehydratase [Pontibacter sp. G13]
MLVATGPQIKQADHIQIHERHVPGIVLMEQAAGGATQEILKQYPDQQTFLILAGPGNNGGDGLVIARHLHLAGKDVQIILSHDPARYQGDAEINYRIIGELPIPINPFGQDAPSEVLSSFPTPPLLIDALLGFGVTEPLRGSILELVQFFRKTSLPTVAIDLPSGLNANTGETINPVIRAEHTITFQLPKVCHVVTPAMLECGQVHVHDIGIWPEVIEELGIQRRTITGEWISQQIPLRPTAGHKGTFGHVLVIGGSRQMAGAPILTASAAIRAGAGLCTALVPESCRLPFYSHVPEAMCLTSRSSDEHLTPDDARLMDQHLSGKSAIALGPGMGTHPDTRKFLAEALPMIQVPLILDADGLNILSQMPELWAMLPEQTILTPHPGEMRRLTGLENVNARRMESAERLAQDRQVTVLLKGAGTIIAHPDGRTHINTTGNPGMATGGSGDVLSGVIAALAAGGMGTMEAASAGAFFHGQAGDRAATQLGQAHISAMDLISQLRTDCG